MRTSFLAAMLLAATYAAAADTVSLAGKWKIQQSAGGNESQRDCTFIQKDAELSGTCGAPDRGTSELTGKVEGNKITFTYQSDSPGGKVTVVYHGTAGSANKITGKVTAVEYSIEGDFTATRVQ